MILRISKIQHICTTKFYLVIREWNYVIAGKRIEQEIMLKVMNQAHQDYLDFLNAYTHTWHEIYLFLFACPASPAMIYWVLKESIYQPKTLNLTWLSFKFEGKISTLRHSQHEVCFSHIKTAERKVKFKKQKRGKKRER